jgi:PRD domain protein (TIGR03582 family)
METAEKNIENPKDYIYQQFSEYHIKIPEKYQEVFENHINTLVTRIQNHECLSVDDHEMKGQLSPESMKLAEKIMRPLMKQYHIADNTSEVVLLAVYIDLANKEKGKGIWEDR